MKVGDFTTYTSTLKQGKFSSPGTMTQTVTAKTENQVTIKTSGSRELSGVKYDLPPTELKIDTTKPFDPQKFADFPFGADPKLEKIKEGKEKIKVNGKEYDCTWVSYSLKAKLPGGELNSQIKVWTSKDVPMGTVKMTMIGMPSGEKDEMMMELKEAGNKK